MSHATKYHPVHDGKGATYESIYRKVSAMTSSSVWRHGTVCVSRQHGVLSCFIHEELILRMNHEQFLMQITHRTSREKWTVTWFWSCAVASLSVVVVRSRRILNSLMKRGNNDCRRFKKIPPKEFATKAMRRGSTWSLQSKLSFSMQR